MYERFTDRARKVMQLANQEALRFKHHYVGTEHILLGLVREGLGVAANVLMDRNIAPRRIRREVDKIVRFGFDVVAAGSLPQTPGAKKVVELSVEEAHQLNHKYVGTEHLLLGLLREEEGVAAQVLKNLGLTADDVREEVLKSRGTEHDPQSRLRHFFESQERELPPDAQQAVDAVNAHIELLNQGKVAAITEQDFETAVHLRDQADRLQQRTRTIRREWHVQYTVDPSWLSWSRGTVLQMAHAISEERRWQDLPILADALEEAGCTNQQILGHCRQPGEHILSCWVLDLLLTRR